MVDPSPSKQDSSGKRARCDRCERPLATCLCPWLVPVEHEVELTILRHPDEASHALNTARLLASMCTACRLLDGDTFTPDQVLNPARTPLLLYPGEASQPLEELAAPASALQLILLDGTWRKTRHLLRLNPWLEDLPRVQIGTGPSRYILRKQKPEGTSTLEAAVAALACLEPPAERYAPLNAALDAMMNMQRKAMGEARFQKDFGGRNKEVD